MEFELVSSLEIILAYFIFCVINLLSLIKCCVIFERSFYYFDCPSAVNKVVVLSNFLKII